MKRCIIQLKFNVKPTRKRIHWEREEESVKVKKIAGVLLGAVIIGTLAGCGGQQEDGSRTTIEFFLGKRECINTFESLIEKFEKENPDIHVEMSAPSDPISILKTRLIKNDEPDMVAVLGDSSYTSFVDSDMFLDLTGEEILDKVKPVYMEMADQLESIPKEGVYTVPFAGNANVVLYNKDIFEENNLQTPKTWSEYIDLCEVLQEKGVLPCVFGFKDAWNVSAPWGAIVANTVGSDLYSKVNKGEAALSEAYDGCADQMAELASYGQEDLFGYGYNDACVSFANGEAAMFHQGNWALPVILQTNPDANIGMFVLPVTDKEEDNHMTTQIDLMFSLFETTDHKEECMQFMEFLLEEENMQQYMDEQTAVPAIEGNFTYARELEEVKHYFDEEDLVMSAQSVYNAAIPYAEMVQTYLIDGDKENFLARMDKEWVKANKNIIRKMKEEN